jgi:hypothetical protein
MKTLSVVLVAVVGIGALVLVNVRQDTIGRHSAAGPSVGPKSSATAGVAGDPPVASQVSGGP